MTYYILPKTNNESPQISPVFFETMEEAEKNVTSNSVRLRRDILLNQIAVISRNNNKTRQKICFKKPAVECKEEVLPPGISLSSSPLHVSLIGTMTDQIKEDNNSSGLLSEFIEINGVFNISDIGKNNHQNHSFDFLNFSALTTPEISSAISCHVKITSPKTSLQSYAINLKRLNLDLDFNAMFFDTVNRDQSTEYYFRDLICALFVILKSTSNGGTTVVKMSTMTLQIELDVVYILNYVFEKAYILKPESSNIINDDKYIVCKNFVKKRSGALATQITSLIEPLSKKYIGNIGKLLHDELTSTFLIKIEEINVIIGQKQMDGLCQMINSIKHKSTEDSHAPWQKTAVTHNAFNHRLSKYVSKPDDDQKLEKEG